VYHPENQKVWVRMPEIWVTKKHKFKYCYWPETAVSDTFQNTLLKQLFEKYKLNDVNVADMHHVNAQKRHENQK
jgi:hypothetical protein